MNSNSDDVGVLTASADMATGKAEGLSTFHPQADPVASHPGAREFSSDRSAPFSSGAPDLLCLQAAPDDDNSELRDDWPVAAPGVVRDAPSPVSGTALPDYFRTAIHEAGHWIAGRLSGRTNGRLALYDGGGGLCWWDDDADGEREISEIESERKSTKAQTLADIVELSTDIRESHEPGEQRSSGHMRLLARALEELPIRMAGLAAEMLLCGGEPGIRGAGSDFAHAKAFASRCCSSEESARALVVWGLAEATAILQDHRVPVLAIAEALVERRTLNDPAEIDRIIATGLAREGLAAEHARRDAMRATAERVVANASLFEPMVRD